MMHTGAAKNKNSTNGHQMVPVDSSEDDDLVYMRLYNSYLDKKGLDLGKILVYLFELMCKHDLKKIKEVEYSKKFFTRYYFVDAETFNKWIESFCPELYSNDFKKKRKFTNEEANLIFENLGTLIPNELIPSTRRELFENIFHDSANKKSKNYEAIKTIFDEETDKYEDFNKLPPIVTKKILYEETRDSKYLQNNRDSKLEKQVLVTIKFMEYYFPKYTEREWNIRKRWLRRYFNKPESI